MFWSKFGKSKVISWYWYTPGKLAEILQNYVGVYQISMKRGLIHFRLGALLSWPLVCLPFGWFHPLRDPCSGASFVWFSSRPSVPILMERRCIWQGLRSTEGCLKILVWEASKMLGSLDVTTIWSSRAYSAWCSVVLIQLGAQVLKERWWCFGPTNSLLVGPVFRSGSKFWLLCRDWSRVVGSIYIGWYQVFLFEL